MNRAKGEVVTFTKEPYIDDVGPLNITSVEFSTLSSSEIAKISKVEVWRTNLNDRTGKPIPGGLVDDSRMGPPCKTLTCETCHGSFDECQGHYGCFTLAHPVYHAGFFKHTLKIVKSICKGCARILLEEETHKKHLTKLRDSKMDRLQKIRYFDSMVHICEKVVECTRCGYINGKVRKGKVQMGLFPSIEHGSRPLDPLQVLCLFERMCDQDCELLCIGDRPENLITTNIAVPPNVVRPTALMNGGSMRREDVTTTRLKNIIQANAALHQELTKPKGSGPPKFQEFLDKLQLEVAQYINCDAVSGGDELPGFVQRLKGKQGRFRGNLCAKRVDYTGRTVISPDPNLKITEVAIPIHMAQVLTYPERVTRHNIEKLRQCVRNGLDKYPGAKQVRRLGGHQWSLNFCRSQRANELKFGDIVDRHLEDGDIVLFNRQPSLHRMSMMCHRARIMPWRTLRFNESVCNPYNADFDGDEMNIHVPQTEEARTEAILLMTVRNNLCTPKNGEILVAATQDFLTTSFLITRKDTFYDRSTFSLICSYMGDAMDPIDLPTPAIIKPLELWSGKQLFSILMRPHANVRVYVNLTVKEKMYNTKLDDRKRELKTMCPNDGFVYFRNSELISGQLGKATLGNGNKDGLFSVLLRDYKADAAAACMNRIAKLSARWIGNHGFSIGIDDVQPKERLVHNKDETISDGYEKCDGFIENFNKGELVLQAGCDAAQTLEAKIFEELNGLRDALGKVCMQTLHWRNSPLIMSQCGSKGSPINICQMVACVGQQSVGGCRVTNGFIDRNLPHFPKKVETPGAKGFVANSFFSGLSATEFFFHTMGGREGLVDTAVKTAECGYMSRRLTKGLEDLFLHYDCTVRNTGGGIVQFCYGDDGMDPVAMEGKNGKPLNFERLYLRSKAICPNNGDDAVLSSSDVCKVFHKKLLEVSLEDDMMSPAGSSAEFINSLQAFVKDSTKIKEAFTEDDFNDLKNFILSTSGTTRRQLEVFLDLCLSRYRSKKIETGTPIGMIGAHSIGEPGTQMTLKTFHFAGVASMNITLGVPRIGEIIDGSKKIRTPIITAVLQRNDNIQTARMVKGRIEKTKLGEVAKTIKLVTTSRSSSIIISLDMKSIQDLQIDANTVKESILRTKKLKLKPEDIKILDIKKLEVVPQVADRSKIHFQLNLLKSLVPSVVVKGIETAERVVIKNDHDKFELLVEGTGLQHVMGVEDVDGLKTYSNHVIEVEEVLGIEAARTRIIEEIKFTMGSHGMSIDTRHIMLLADVMTNRGQVLGMTRHGISKLDKSVLMLSSFEMTADHLFNASMHGSNDPLKGVSERIITGDPIHIGTGMMKIKQRLNHLKLPQGTSPLLSED